MKKINNLEVCFYLGPSKISGVGVFSRIKIRKNYNIDKLITDDTVFIKKSTDKEILKKLCIKKEGGWDCPSDFSRPSFWWYLNHSEKPNIECKNDKFITKKTIKKDEELTINYKNLDSSEDEELITKF